MMMIDVDVEFVMNFDQSTMKLSATVQEITSVFCLLIYLYNSGKKQSLIGIFCCFCTLVFVVVFQSIFQGDISMFTSPECHLLQIVNARQMSHYN